MRSKSNFINRLSIALGILICVSVNAQTVPAGHIVTTLSNVNTDVWAITIDDATRDVYYGGSDQALRKRTSAGVVSNLGSLNAICASGFYPFGSTDIAFDNGFVYVTNDNTIGRLNTTTLAASNNVYTGTATSWEAGCEKAGSLIYTTRGTAGSNELGVYNPATGIFNSVLAGLPVANMDGLRYCAATNKMYVGLANALYSVDLASPSLVLISPTALGPYAHFSIDPTGTYAYATSPTNGEINRIDLATGVSTVWGTGFTNVTFQYDIDCGPSTSGSGFSLYVGASDRMYEITISLGSALNLDGVNDHVTFPYFAPTGDMTIEFNYKSSSAQYGDIMAWAGNTNMSIEVMSDVSGGISYGEWNGSAWNVYAVSAAVNNNAWHKISIVRTSSPNQVQIYVDGVLSVTAGTVALPATNQFSIGMENWFGSMIRPMAPGSLDEVRIWRRALCLSEITNNLNCEIPTTGTNLEANFHFNQGVAGGNNPTVTTLTDASGNVHNGTLIGFALNGTTSNWIAPGGVANGVSCGTFFSATASSQTNVTCFGGNNGAASVTAVGTGLTYDWTPGNPTGDGTASVTGLTAGTYTCTVTNGCSQVLTVTFNITSPPAGAEINVQGNSTTIVDGDATPSLTDHTDFGSTGVCSGTIIRTFTIQNSGVPVLNVTGVTITGVNAGDFSVTVTPASTVASSGSTTFQVTFNPSATGTRAATINIASDDCDEATYDYAIQGFGTEPEADLRGNGISIPAGDITPQVPDGTDYGSIPVCAGSLAQNFTIHNTGNTNLNLVGFGITSGNMADFSVTGSPSSPIAPGNFTTFQVTFNPTATGVRFVNLGFGNTDCDENPYMFRIQGTGTGNEINLSGNSVNITDGDVTPSLTDHTDFGTQSVCAGTIVRTFTIQNTGNQTLNIASVAITGAQASDYTVTAAPASAVLAAASTTFQVTFNPSANGLRSATITVNSDDCDEAAYDFAILGTGTSVAASAGPQTNVSCFGGSNGSASVTVSGGETPYTYSWAPSGGTAANASGLTAQTYTCTVTDFSGCTSTAIFTITQPTNPVSGNTVVTNVSCFGGSNGAINLTPSGGTGPYTFNWLPSGPTTEDRTGLIAGTYTVQITDVNGCAATVTASVTQPTSPVSGTTVVTNVSCFGGSNGAINLTPTGGTGPYTFNWLPSGPTTEDRTGLIAGTYTVQITDVNGCNGTVTATVTQPASPVSGTTVVTNVACFGGSNGAINLTPTGGTGPYTFNWLPSGPTTEDRTGLIAGTYTVQITDVNGCNGTVTATVTQPASPVSGTTVVTNVSCFGGSNGAINLTPTGGTGAYTFNWLPSGPTTEDRTGLTAGTYTVQITDVNGCVGTVTATVNTPSALVAAVASQTNISCNGGNNGAASVSVSGGTTAYSYNWTPGNPTGDGTASVTGLTAQIYTVTVTDANSCVTTQTFNITAPTALVATPVSQTNVSCFGGTNGSATTGISGGTPGYSYAWMPSGGNAATATGLTAAVYTVTITDANLCVTTQTFNITSPSAITAVATQTNVTCNGGTNGSASVAVSGGAPGYTYAWMPSGGNAATETGLASGIYTVTITDANSCLMTQTFNITAPIALSVLSSVTNVSCNGGADGSANVVVMGGVAPFTYAWTPSGGTSATASGLTPGAYTCTITDNNGCTITESVTITEPTPLSVTESSVDITCFGADDGSADVVVTGGTGPYTYVWSPSGGNASSATGLSPSLYSCTITDANGCIYTSTFVINEPSLLIASSSATSVACNGGSATVTVTGAGGTTPYTGDGTFIVTAGTYTYTVTDANGCTSTTTVIVTEPTALAASSSSTSIACNGGNATVTVVATGGTAPYTGDGTFTETAGTHTYLVTDANGCTFTTTITITEPTALVATSSATSIACNGGNSTITVVATGGTAPYTGEGTYTVIAGTYSYLITDANGCTTTTSITVTEPTAISTSVTSVNVSCNAASDGSIDLTVSGGTAPYTFDWNSGTYTTEDLTGLAPGTYTGVLTDANGCTDGGSITITEPAALVATIVSATDPTSCGGTDGAVDISVAGGTLGYAFLWSNSATTEDLSGVGAGAYLCSITDTNGCTTAATALLNDPNAPVVTLTITSDTVCLADGAFTLNGESPAGGTFSGPGVSAGMFDPMTAGVGTHAISYTYTDVSGCTGSTTDSIYVDICLDANAPTLTSTFTVYPNPNNGSFTLQLNNISVADVMIYDVQGKLVSTQKVYNNNEIITIAESGMYMITVITADGVQTSQRVIVTE